MVSKSATVAPITTWSGEHFISVDQLTSKKHVLALFAKADLMKKRVEKHAVYEPLKGKSIAILFYQPSTRTFSSFVAAAQRLGAYVTAIHGMDEFSSVSKGESLEDTIRSIYQTTAADAIVLRHPDDSSSAIAALVSSVPIINAGSGKKEHPTQALLDLYSLYQTQGNLKKLKIAMVGDLLYGRTVKSLAKLLALVAPQVEIYFISPAELQAPPELVRALREKCIVHESDDLHAILPELDAIYMTRVQKEWFEKAGKMAEYEQIKDKFILTRHMVTQMKPTATVMHPLPRVGEIMHEVDDDPRAFYFQQMRAGLYVRMALLDSILSGKKKSVKVKTVRVKTKKKS